MVAILMLFALFASDEEAILGAIQRLFDAMAARDAAALASVLLPQGARIVSVRQDGAVGGSAQGEWVQRIAASKDSLRETIHDPRILVRGRLASVWARYDFYRNGKRTHGGIDSFTLVKTAEGWKISCLVYSVEAE